MWESAIGEFLGSFVGVLGALLVFWVGVRYSKRQEEVRLEWEFMSALQLLLVDLLHHRNALKSYASNRASVWTYPDPPNTATWEETRWRIAQLGGGDAWTDLATYYARVRTLETWRQGPPDLEAPELTNLLSDMQQQSEDIISAIKESLLTGAKGQDRRPWWKRMFRS